MSWETAGTVTVTNNSATVTGAGTLFTAKSRVGDAFIGPDGRLYEITNIVSDFVLRISPKYLGETLTTQPYKIAPVRGYQKLSADRLYAVSSKIFEIGDTVLKLPQWLKDLDPTPVEAGGTGGTTSEEARANLGLKNSAVLDVGTEAGTVAAGDDSRLSNSREWIAETVEKLEAEEGTENIRRAWTSLRVRESTEAWWNNITGAFGRNLASSAYIEDARSKLDISNLDNTSDTDKPVSSAQLAALNLKSNISDIVDNLASEETAKPLSAKQGKILKQYIDTINTLLQSDDTNLDELQEIVDFIKLNRDDLDSLSIPSIAGLQEALDLKVNLSDNRLSNSREWIADTVGKEEAEEGNSEERKAWNALRVKEAILARVTDGTLATGLEVANKVDKIPGKGLSDVNFTQVDKDKLDANVSVPLVDKAVAEAGTNETIRAWSALRVRQAITGWWASITGVFGRDLVTSANNTVARGKLGLGTAATKDVGTGAGNVIEVGAFGVGGAGKINDEDFLLRNNGLESVSIGAGVISYAPLQSAFRAISAIKDDWGFSIVAHPNSDRIYFKSRWYNNAKFFNEFTHSGNLLTSTGSSTAYPMSQRAVTTAINGISDLRDKTEVGDLDIGLNLLEKIKPKTYKLNMRDKYRTRDATKTKQIDGETVTEVDKDVMSKPLSAFDSNDGSEAGSHVYTGFIAQELKSTLEEMGLGNLGLVKNFSEEYEGGEDRFYIEHTGLIAILVKSVQQLKEMNDDLSERLSVCENIINSESNI